MRLSRFLPVLIAMALAGAASIAAAIVAVDRLEERALTNLRLVMVQTGHDWVGVEVDGLQVTMSGTAPDEAGRFSALSTAGTVIDATRLIDAMEVAAREDVEPPRFSVEILRNSDGVSLFGLVPEGMDRDDIVARVEAIAGSDQVTDLLEAAEFPIPVGWDNAIAFALDALGASERSKISVSADAVSVTAIADSTASKQRLETMLARDVPEGITLALDISAPRPVISPFTLRFLLDDGDARFDSCSAGTEAARDQIFEAAGEAGFGGEADCVIGLGAPSRDWPEAVTAGIRALRAAGGGKITFSDLDVTLVALEGTTQDAFDLAVGQLENRLPDAYSLHAVLPERPPEEGNDDPGAPAVPEFVGSLTEDGSLQMRGRIPDEQIRRAVEGYAAARFGTANVLSETRLDAGLPQGWPVRVMVGLEALSQLNHGTVLVRQDIIDLRGVTGSEDVRQEVSQLLSDRLGGGSDFEVEIRYDSTLNPVEDLPTPEECVQRINSILSIQQITFAPGSTDIEETAAGTIDTIAEALRQCQTVAMEIGGHTDSQGRETMNLRLSQGRAETVLNEIMARRVLTSNLTAKGFGETRPIADNESEEGREANRRIEFRLASEADDDDGGVTEITAGAAEADGSAEGEDASADGAEAEDESNEQN